MTRKNSGLKLKQQEAKVKIIEASEFDAYWKDTAVSPAGKGVVADTVNAVIAEVRAHGDAAVRRFASRFDKSSPYPFEVPREALEKAWADLPALDPALAGALRLAADNIRRFAEFQKEQFKDFETQIAPGLFAGQRVIPVERAALYAPAGRYPLVSTVLMGLIPAAVAGVGELLLASPPLEDGLPDRRILAAACLAGARRVFAVGGAQAIAALALGTETIPRADFIAGPGNKYVTAAKRTLFGEAGIDFAAGPTDVLIISGEKHAGGPAADLIAADMLAQAEHDPDARARALVPAAGGDGKAAAGALSAALESRLERLPTAEIARASLDAGGLIIVYKTMEEAVRIANTIAPEHLELQVPDPQSWVPALKNYGSLFIGASAAEVLGDYSAGINHTLPTSGSARFSGGLSVRHFLKTVTTLRCSKGSGTACALEAAAEIARAEGLEAHRQSALARSGLH
jgi:histidinol dehydrogenase